jgi:hypothetical protein
LAREAWRRCNLIPENPATSAADEAIVLKVAKTLQSSFTTQTAGEARKWRDVPPHEKKTSIRLARNARKVIIEGS